MKNNIIYKLLSTSLVCLSLLNPTKVQAAVLENPIQFITEKDFSYVITELDKESATSISNLQIEIKEILKENGYSNIKFIGWNKAPGRMDSIDIIIHADNKYLNLNCGIVKDEKDKIFVEYLVSYSDYEQIEDLLKDIGIKEYTKFNF